MNKKFYVTTPIYYVNAKPHIGHAYTTIAADILARHYRFKGGQVLFLTGTDEHGAKIQQAAEKAGIPTQQFCDQNAEKFRKYWDAIDLSYDDFIRTTDQRHEVRAKILLQHLYDQGFIYKDKYAGLYCVGCEAYKTEAELVDGKCPDHQTEPVYLEEENWFFKASQFNQQLKELIESDELLVRPVSRKNEMLSLLKEGLKDIAISRQNLKWGIRLPFDDTQTCYVWIEALMNYVTAVGYGQDEELFEKYWPAEVHLMAKDILRFHALIWPAMLLAAGLPLPKLIYAHGFFTVNGQKMSKTLGNVIDPIDASNKFGVDAFRYLLISQTPFGEDGDISLDRMADRYQAELVNGLGNLVSRVLAMASKQQLKFDYRDSAEFHDRISNLWQNYPDMMAQLKFKLVLEEIWQLISFCDKYVEDKKPWTIKNQPKELNRIFSNLIEAIRHIALALKPFMPEKSKQVLKNIQADDFDLIYADLIKWGLLTGQKNYTKPEILFARLDK